MEGSFCRVKGDAAGSIEGDVTHDTSDAALTCHQFVENCYLKPEKNTRTKLSHLSK